MNGNCADCSMDIASALRVGQRSTVSYCTFHLLHTDIDNRRYFLEWYSLTIGAFIV